jgi:hypothetical protein
VGDKPGGLSTDVDPSMRGSLAVILVAVVTAAMGCSRPNPAYLIEGDDPSAAHSGHPADSGGAREDAAGPDQGSTPDTLPPDAPAVDRRPADAAMMDAPREATPLDVAPNPDRASLPAGNGLLVELWDGTQLEMGTGTGHDRDWTDQMINFDWGTATPTGDNTFDNDQFSMRFRGHILPAYSESYTFICESDDGVRLWIDDLEVFDSWTGIGFTTTMGRLPLTGGVKHKFLMEYRESTGQASVKLFWSSASLGAKQIVPKAALFYP